MLILLELIYLSYNKEEMRRLFFSSLGLLLGVALFVSIRISSENVKLAIEASKNVVASQFVEIVSDSGDLPEGLVKKIAGISGIKAIIPMMKKTLEVPQYLNNDISFVNVIGLDFLKLKDIYPDRDHVLKNDIDYLAPDPISVLASQKLTSKITGMMLPLEINGNVQQVKIRNVIPKELEGMDENKILMDIYHFQTLFKQYGHVSEIAILLFDPQNKEVIKEIQAQLPASVKVMTNNERSAYLDDITATFRFNLNFLITLTLLVTGIMTYNSISYYVLERRHEFSILMMLGAKPLRLVITVLAGNTLIAILSTVSGIFLGYLLAKIMIALIAQSISNIYFPLDITQIHLSSFTISTIFLIAIVTTWIASIIPCREIYKTTMRETISYQTYEQGFKKKITVLSIIGIVLLSGSLISIHPHILLYSSQIAFVSMLGIMVSIAFFQPIMLDYFLRFIERVLGKIFFASKLAAEHIHSTMRKHVIAISAMSMAIVLCAISFTIIDSTKKHVLDWVNQVNSANIYIKSAKNSSLNEYLPENVLQIAKSMPGVANYNVSVSKDIIYKNKPLTVEGIRFEALVDQNIVRFKTPETRQILQEIATPNAVFISDRTANQFNLKPGDSISIPTNHGPYLAKVAAVYYNYSSDRNFILMDVHRFSTMYDQRGIEEIALYLHNPRQSSSVIKQLRSELPNPNIVIQDNAQVKQTSNDIVTQAFGVGNVILVITLLAAVITLFITIEELILSRANEFTIFWMMGAKDFQIIAMCLWESMLVCCAAIINAIIPSSIIIYIMFFYLNKLFFGTDISLYIPYFYGMLFMGFLLCVGIIAGLIPALGMKKLMSVERLKYE